MKKFIVLATLLTAACAQVIPTQAIMVANALCAPGGGLKGIYKDAASSYYRAECNAGNQVYFDSHFLNKVAPNV